MKRAEFLEVEIRKCRWLADVVNDDSARLELLKLAVEYESEATQLDRETMRFGIRSCHRLIG